MPLTIARNNLNTSGRSLNLVPPSLPPTFSWGSPTNQFDWLRFIADQNWAGLSPTDIMFRYGDLTSQYGVSGDISSNVWNQVIQPNINSWQPTTGPGSGDTAAPPAPAGDNTAGATGPSGAPTGGSVPTQVVNTNVGGIPRLSKTTLANLPARPENLNLSGNAISPVYQTSGISGSTGGQVKQGFTPYQQPSRPAYLDAPPNIQNVESTNYNLNEPGPLTGQPGGTARTDLGGGQVPNLDVNPLPGGWSPSAGNLFTGEGANFKGVDGVIGAGDGEGDGVLNVIGGTTPPPAGGTTPPPAGGTTPPPAGGTTPPAGPTSIFDADGRVVSGTPWDQFPDAHIRYLNGGPTNKADLAAGLASGEFILSPGGAYYPWSIKRRDGTEIARFSSAPMIYPPDDAGGPPAGEGDVFAWEPPVNNLLPQLEGLYNDMIGMLNDPSKSKWLGPLLNSYDQSTVLSNDALNQSLAVRGITDSTLADDARTRQLVNQQGGRAALAMNTLGQEFTPRLSLLHQIWQEGAADRATSLQGFIQFLNAQNNMDATSAANATAAMTLLFKSLGLLPANASLPGINTGGGSTPGQDWASFWGTIAPWMPWLQPGGGTGTGTGATG